ncbi:MAG: glycosyltransferase family 4 protein [Candidatus Helarchaeota archaeon]
MRILLLTIYNYPHPGGVSSHISALKEGLENLKTKCDIFSANSLPLFFILFLRTLYVLRKINKAFFYALYLKIMKFIFEIAIFIKFLKKKWNLINAQDPTALNCTKLIQLFYRPKLILTLHGFLAAETLVDLDIKNVFLYNILLNEEKNAYNLANKIITIEISRKKHILKHLNKPHKIFLFKNFVNTSKFKNFKNSYFYSKFNLPMHANIVLFPKRLVKVSGINYFIEAAKEILKKSSEFYFIIIGKGYLLKEVLKSAKKNSNILFHDPVPNNLMPIIFNSSKIIVIPSISIGSVKEGSSMAILEAMACGTPVIATPVGGNRELIKHEQTGILVPEKKSKELAKAIIDLSRNKGLWNKISKNSREYITKNFSHVNAAKFFLKIYLSR